MKVRNLIERLSSFPSNADVVVINPTTREKKDIMFITWKNSAERVNIYYEGDKNETD